MSSTSKKYFIASFDSFATQRANLQFFCTFFAANTMLARQEEVLSLSIQANNAFHSQ